MHKHSSLFLLLTLLLFAIPMKIKAQGRSQEEALQIASRWFAQRGAQSFTMESRSNAAKLTKTKDYKAAWCFCKGKDFVMVGNDERQPTILGYGKLKYGQMPTMLQAMLSKRQSCRNRYPLDGTSWSPVEPLLTSKHFFGSPYNDLCPFYTDDMGTISTQRCVAGCVAIAMEQILAYYKRTYTLQDTLKGWKTSHYTIDNILPGETVDASLIRDSYKEEQGTPEEREAAAKLIYYLGVASKMQWGLSSSGTNTWRLVEPLKRAFGLKYVHHLDSYQYSPVAFWNFLAKEIEDGRPVYYAGSAMNLEGHAIVLDGIDADGLFHVNWGFAGDYDGYFRLDVLSLREPEDEHKEFNENGFFCNQEALVVCPDEVSVVPPDTIGRTGREFSIDSLWCVDEPSSKCSTRIKMIVRNTSDQPLTTPFALLQNVPTDTALMQQAKWLSFTGRTLQPYESDTLLVHTCFSQSGEIILSVTPDGEQILYSARLNVGSSGTQEMEESEDVLFRFVDETTVDISQPISNSADSRSSQNYLFDLTDEETQTNAHKAVRVYLNAQCDTIVTVRFTHLTPGGKYTYRLRCSWPIVLEKHFSMPQLDEIGKVYKNEKGVVPYYYSTDGKLIGNPNSISNGIVIEVNNGKSRKTIAVKR